MKINPKAMTLKQNHAIYGKPKHRNTLKIMTSELLCLTTVLDKLLYDSVVTITLINIISTAANINTNL